MIEISNIFTGVPSQLPSEQIVTLMNSPGVRIERIVSHGHQSPPGFWYDEPTAEWVVLLEGSAEIQFADEHAPRRLKRGDHLNIPAHARHRVTWTDSDAPTIWLAVHYG